MGHRLLLSAILLSLSVASLSAQKFQNPVQIATPSSPHTVFAFDLNGDGRLDLLYGTWKSSVTMTSLLAQSDGTYKPAATATLPANIGNCRPVAFTASSFPSLVCTYADSTTSGPGIASLMGNGDGSFQTPVYSSSATPASSNWIIVAASDLNGDGNTDLVVSLPGLNTSYVLLGTGSGVFTTRSTIQNNFTVGLEMKVTDLNGDGKLDLVSSEGPVVWLGNGDGTFGTASIYGTVETSPLCVYHDIWMAMDIWMRSANFQSLPIRSILARGSLAFSMETKMALSTQRQSQR